MLQTIKLQSDATNSPFGARHILYCNYCCCIITASLHYSPCEKTAQTDSKALVPSQCCDPKPPTPKNTLLQHFTHTNKGDFPTTTRSHSMVGGGQAARWIIDSEISVLPMATSASPDSCCHRECYTHQHTMLFKFQLWVKVTLQLWSTTFFVFQWKTL